MDEESESMSLMGYYILARWLGTSTHISSSLNNNAYLRRTDAVKYLGRGHTRAGVLTAHSQVQTIFKKLVILLH